MLSCNMQQYVWYRAALPAFSTIKHDSSWPRQLRATTDL